MYSVAILCDPLYHRTLDFSSSTGIRFQNTKSDDAFTYDPSGEFAVEVCLEPQEQKALELLPADSYQPGSPMLLDFSIKRDEELGSPSSSPRQGPAHALSSTGSMDINAQAAAASMMAAITKALQPSVPGHEMDEPTFPAPAASTPAAPKPSPDTVQPLLEVVEHLSIHSLPIRGGAMGFSLQLTNDSHIFRTWTIDFTGCTGLQFSPGHTTDHIFHFEPEVFAVDVCLQGNQSVQLNLVPDESDLPPGLNYHIFLNTDSSLFTAEPAQMSSTAEDPLSQGPKLSPVDTETAPAHSTPDSASTAIPPYPEPQALITASSPGLAVIAGASLAARSLEQAADQMVLNENALRQRHQYEEDMEREQLQGLISSKVTALGVQEIHSLNRITQAHRRARHEALEEIARDKIEQDEWEWVMAFAKEVRVVLHNHFISSRHKTGLQQHNGFTPLQPAYAQYCPRSNLPQPTGCAQSTGASASMQDCDAAYTAFMKHQSGSCTPSPEGKEHNGPATAYIPFATFPSPSIQNSRQAMSPHQAMGFLPQTKTLRPQGIFPHNAADAPVYPVQPGQYLGLLHSKSFYPPWMSPSAFPSIPQYESSRASPSSPAHDLGISGIRRQGNVKLLPESATSGQPNVPIVYPKSGAPATSLADTVALTPTLPPLPTAQKSFVSYLNEPEYPPVAKQPASVYRTSHKNNHPPVLTDIAKPEWAGGYRAGAPTWKPFMPVTELSWKLPSLPVSRGLSL